jgi:HSP20 family protein
MSEKEEATKREGRRQETGPAMLPPVDIVEDETGIMLVADLPGVSKDKLTVRVDGQTLVIEGEIGLATPDGMEAMYAEVQAARYRRNFTLSRELDTAKIDAALKDGVLKLRMSKTEQAQPRQIEVKAG